MDRGKYTFSALEKKYDNFRAPDYTVSIGGKKLAHDKVFVTGLEVTISANGTAGGCSFTIEGMYDQSKSIWDEKILDTIKVGAKLVIEGGYVKKKEIFYGYIDDYEVSFAQGDSPKITVCGLDGLGYLMSRKEPLYAGKKQAAEVVRTILNKSVSAGFAKKVTLGTLSGFGTPILKEQLDDWKFLNLMAARYGVSMLVVDGEIIFDKVTATSSPIMQLILGRELRTFSRRVSMAHQVGKVEVLGRDIDQNPIKGTASSVSAPGKGKSAAQIVSALKDAVYREYSEYAQTEKECTTIAQNRLNGIAMGLVKGRGECVGLPELIPGRYVTIDGVDRSTKGDYFITTVTHSFTVDSYTTSFEVAAARA